MHFIVNILAKYTKICKQFFAIMYYYGEPTGDTHGHNQRNADESRSPLDNPSGAFVQPPETSEKLCACILLGMQSGGNLAQGRGHLCLA